MRAGESRRRWNQGFMSKISCPGRANGVIPLLPVFFFTSENFDKIFLALNFPYRHQHRQPEVGCQVNPPFQVSESVPGEYIFSTPFDFCNVDTA